MAAAVAALIGGSVATTPIASPADARAGSVTAGDPAQELDWQPCHLDRTTETGTVFECAELLVPLDYDRVGGGRIVDGGAERGNDDLISIALVPRSNWRASQPGGGDPGESGRPG
jgi:hypothetical protein